MDLSTVAKKQTRIQGNREIVSHESAEMYERIADALGSISDLSTNGLQIRTLAASARTEPQVQKDPDTGRPAMSFAAYAVWDKLALMTLVLQGFLLGLANGASCLATCAPLLLPYIVAEGRPIRRSAIMTSECRSNPAPADFAKSHGKAALWSLPMLALSLFMAFG